LSAHPGPAALAVTQLGRDLDDCQAGAEQDPGGRGPVAGRAVDPDSLGVGQP